ncbi:hypothetical protein EF879_06650 [Micromonospora sp. HM5-17]|nr:hypothetical protein EF879_06650 [Micromonospora sp. HM5-17]
MIRQDEAGLWVWVVGHEQPRCGWTSTPVHAPCLHLLVRVDALTRAAAHDGARGSAGARR